MPNNYSSAVSQLKSLERRLEKDENLKQRYKETIDVDVQKGFVRILDEAEIENTKTDLPSVVRSSSSCDEPEQAGQSETSVQRCLRVRRRFTKGQFDGRSRPPKIAHWIYLQIQGEKNCLYPRR